MFVIIKWTQDQCIRDNISKKGKEKKRYRNPHYIPHKHFPYHKKSPMLTLPVCMTTLISKLLPLFVTSDKG